MVRKLRLSFSCEGMVWGVGAGGLGLALLALGAPASLCPGVVDGATT